MSDNISKLIIKFNRETVSGNIIWERSHRAVPLSLSGNEQLIGFSYVANVNNKMLQIYKFQYRDYTDEDTYTWVEDIRLEFIDNLNHKTVYIFPYDRITHDLYASILYKTSGIDDFINDYLTQDELRDGNPDLPF